MGEAMKKFVALAVTVFLLMAISELASASHALAASPHGPLGYQLMCLKHPAECRGGGAATVAASPQLLAVLQQVNAAVNRQLRPQQDKNGDVWTVGAKAGDCEDYALTKRRRLIDVGLPASALRIAYVHTRSGAGHAVLVINTVEAQYVLDNLTASIRSLDQSGYEVISMQGADPNIWG